MNPDGSFVSIGTNTYSDDGTSTTGYCPDDCAAGSTFSFIFADPAPVEVIEASFVDLEEGAVDIQFCRDIELYRRLADSN